MESSDNVLLSLSCLDLLRLRKSTWVIGISIWHDVDSILRRCAEGKRRKGLNVAAVFIYSWRWIFGQCSVVPIRPRFAEVTKVYLSHRHFYESDLILRRCVEAKRRKGFSVAGRCLNIWCSIYTYRNYWLLSEKYFHFWISGMDQTKHSYHPGNSVKLSHLGHGSKVKSNQRGDQKNNLFFQPFLITLSFLYFVSEWS